MIDKKSPIEGMTLLSAVPHALCMSHSLSEHECNEPDTQDDADPCSPTNKAVAVCVAGVAEEPVEDELGGDVGIDSADYHCRDQDEDEGALTCPRLGQGTDGWRSRVLAHVLVADGGDDREEDHLESGERRQCLGDCIVSPSSYMPT